MRYMLLRNIYIRSSYFLHYSPVLLKRSVYFSQPDCYHNLKIQFFLVFLNQFRSSPLNLHIRTQTVTHLGILISYTRLTGTTVPLPTCVSELTHQARLEYRFHTPDLTGTTVPPPPCVSELILQPRLEYRFHTPDLTGTMVPLYSAVSITIQILRLLL